MAVEFITLLARRCIGHREKSVSGLKHVDSLQVVTSAHQIIFHKSIKLNHVLELIIKDFFNLCQVHRPIRASRAIHRMNTESTGWLKIIFFLIF